MKTSKQWWQETKTDSAKLNAWLLKQYTGEVTAAQRILDLRDKFKAIGSDHKILTFIANQEQKHAMWILELLQNRGIEPEIGDPNKRYWKETLQGIEDLETGAAVGAHAEAMRLDRIREIAYDVTAPHDIVTKFSKILIDEIGHEKMFRKLSSPEALEATRANHESGAAALGLVS
jgi:rubrerythrin